MTFSRSEALIFSGFQIFLPPFFLFILLVHGCNDLTGTFQKDHKFLKSLTLFRFRIVASAFQKCQIFQKFLFTVQTETCSVYNLTGLFFPWVSVLYRFFIFFCLYNSQDGYDSNTSKLLPPDYEKSKSCSRSTLVRKSDTSSVLMRSPNPRRKQSHVSQKPGSASCSPENSAWQKSGTWISVCKSL